MEQDNNSGTYQAKQVKPFLKPLLIVSSIILIAIAIFGYRALSRKSRDKELINGAKSYYAKYDSLLPKEYGECVRLEINELAYKHYIKAEKYGVCDREKTYVKVCKLESGNYQYTPFVSCNGKDDIEYGEYVEGTEKDITPDVSDIRFTFLPQIFSNKFKIYYPSNKNNGDEVIEYYDKAPNEEYKYREANGIKAYKWYKSDNGTNYWNNGSFTSEKPDGYNKKGDEGEPVVKYSIDKPETKDYRTIKETIVYRKKENSIARPFKYICTDSKVSGTVTSTTKCEERQTDKFKTTLGILYTCDGSTQVAQNTVCSQGEWSEWTINSCASEGTTQCESKKGYKYTDRVWKWYIEGNYRKYYPSGNASSKEENTYYLTSPAEGYVRDDDSEATVYKYFKTTDEVNGNTAGWIVIDDNYYTEEELFNKFKEYNFEVNSILDIKNNQNIQYEIKMEYRNRR